MDDTADEPEPPPGSSNVGKAVTFEQVGLQVQLTADRGLLFLDVRSRLDRSQGLLLPTGHRPVLTGVSLSTRLGRLHALYWTLAYGLDLPEPDASVRFQSTALRHRRTAVAAPRDLAAGCWVAAAEGAFDVAVLVIAGNDTARVSLADRW